MARDGRWTVIGSARQPAGCTWLWQRWPTGLNPAANRSAQLAALGKRRSEGEHGGEGRASNGRGWTGWTEPRKEAPSPQSHPHASSTHASRLLVPPWSKSRSCNDMARRDHRIDWMRREEESCGSTPSAATATGHRTQDTEPREPGPGPRETI